MLSDLYGVDELLRGVDAARHIGTLGYMPVLAERAAEIAARESRRKDFRTGPEMIKGLFFNGVDRETGNEPVKWDVRLSVRVKPNKALALFARSEKAAPGAEDALHPFIRKRVKKAGVTHDGA